MQLVMLVFCHNYQVRLSIVQTVMVNMVYYHSGRTVHNLSVHWDQKFLAAGPDLSDGIFTASSVSDVPPVA